MTLLTVKKKKKKIYATNAIVKNDDIIMYTGEMGYTKVVGAFFREFSVPLSLI